MNILARLLCLAAILWAWQASAHDAWISRQKRHNPAGEWCCNEADCKRVQAYETPRGYHIQDTGEEVPRSEAALSGDADYWVCRRPDKSRRCFFVPAGM